MRRKSLLVLAVLALVAVALLLTFGLPITVSLLGPLDWGPVFGGYLGANGLPSATPVGPLATNHPNDPLAVPGYALLDLRAGIETDRWRFQVWGRNVTNQWYWTAAYRATDSLVRYTGMPTTYGFTLSYRYK